MSLINEALKKVERSRNESSDDAVAASVIGGVRTARHGRPPTANTVLLMGSGAVILVALSVVLTMFLVNRPSPSSERVALATSVTPVPAPAIIPPVTPGAAAPTSPPIVLPGIGSTVASTPATSTTVAAAATSQFSNATPLAATAPAQVPTATQAAAAPSVQEPSPITPAPPASVATEPAPNLAPDSPDERVTAFVESVRVTGIRSSGSESRVLMNERVYRVNDVVDRTLNVRLINASADSLTFRDARGVTYEKRF